MTNALAPVHAGDVPALELDRLNVYRVSIEFQKFVAIATKTVRGELRSASRVIAGAPNVAIGPTFRGPSQNILGVIGE